MAWRVDTTTHGARVPVAQRPAEVAAMRDKVALGIALSATLGCSPGAPRVRVDLIREPTTLSPVPRSFSAGQPLRADNESVGLCVSPGRGYSVSGRWTVLTPGGQEAQVVARAELVGGRVVKLASPSSTGSSLCVHPRRGGPLEAAVQRIDVVASTPIVVQRVVWQSTVP